MSALTKKLPTNEINIKVGKSKTRTFIVPKDKTQGLLKLIQDYEVEETYPWREVMSDLTDNEIGNLLKSYRSDHQLTQTKLAKHLGISQSNIAEMETGKRSVSKLMAKKLGELFGVNYKVFL